LGGKGWSVEVQKEKEMEKDKNYSLTTACLDFFGKLPGQSTLDFANELKQLTEADKAEFKAALQALGYKIA
jgi:hypothetical protein